MYLRRSRISLLSLFLLACNPLKNAKMGSQFSRFEGNRPITTNPSDNVPPAGDVIKKKCDQINLLSSLGYDDTYAGCLWHIINRGQYIKRFTKKSPEDGDYFKTGGVSGADLSLTAYALHKYSGKGVKVHVSDDGLEPTHEDFAANFDIKNSKSCNQFGVEPVDSGDKHGIMVSGAIGAVGKNGKGVSGVAYKASVSGYNAFACQNFIFAIDTPNVDIWNGSYGIESCSAHTREDTNFYKAYMVGGEEYGVLYFKSAGNGRRSQLRCPAGYGDANRDSSNTHPYVFPIAALDSQLKVTTYSNPGASLFLSAPAGYGGSSDLPGVCTITRNNSYTCSMNGTSVSSPNVAGSAALVKEANPSLNNLDIAYIMLKTARVIDEPETTNTHVAKSFTAEGKSYINWSRNSSGFRHSFNSGFGVPNIDAAVKMAESYQENLPLLEQYKKTFNTGTLKSSNDKLEIFPQTCESKVIEASNDFKVFLSRFSLDIKGLIRDLVVFITLPDGTRAQLVRDSEIDGGSYLLSQKFKSYAAMGINARGSWEIEVCNNGNKTVEYSQAQMEVWGYENLNLLK